MTVPLIRLRVALGTAVPNEHGRTGLVTLIKTLGQSSAVVGATLRAMGTCDHR